MALKPPAVATYYVNLWFREDCLKRTDIVDKLHGLAEKYNRTGFADPKMKFLKRPDLRTGDIAFTFEGCTDTGKFLNEIMPLEYIVEVKHGRLDE